MPNRGEVWLANLDPTHGTEPGKTRPVLVVQAQALLDANHPSALIIPLTTSLVDDAEQSLNVLECGRLGPSRLHTRSMRRVCATSQRPS